MNGITALHDKSTLLRSVEHYCYQIAFYVLDNASDAAAANEQALLSLAGDPRFASAGADERRGMAKKAAVACAMLRARERCAANMRKEPHPHVANE